jgi:phage shock protein E
MSRGMIMGLAVAGVVLSSVARAEEPLKHTEDTPATVKANVDAGKALIVDVREQDEWDAGHLKAAILISKSKLDDDALVANLLKKLPKDKVIYTHCGRGGRALVCGEVLKKAGYDVRPLKANYKQLGEAGLETVEPKESPKAEGKK